MIRCQWVVDICFGKQALTLAGVQLKNLSSMFFTDGHANVNRREYYKNECLHQSHKQVQAEEGDGHQDWHQGKECHRHHVTGKHVCIETYCQGQDAGKVADDLDQEHERRQQPNRPQELLDIVSAMMANAIKMVVNK